MIVLHVIHRLFEHLGIDVHHHELGILSRKIISPVTGKIQTHKRLKLSLFCSKHITCCSTKAPEILRSDELLLEQD